MDTSSIEISNSGLFEFIFLGTLIFLAFLVIRFFLQILPIKRKIKTLGTRFLPSIELAVWGIYFIWAATSIFRDNIIYKGLLLLLIIIAALLISRFLAKDLIAGVVLKTENSFIAGDILRFKEFSGIVTKSSFRYLEIETSEGIMIRIPYSTIADNPIIKLNPAEIIKKNQSIKVSTPKYDHIETITGNIKTLIMNFPLVSVTKTPTITKKSETEHEYIFEISISTLDSTYIPIIEEYLKKQLEGKSNIKDTNS